MSGDKYLYGVEDLGFGMSVGKTLILEETKKSIKVKSYIGPYNMIRIPNDDPDLARTEAEAIEVFIRNKKAAIDNLKSRIERFELDIIKAEIL